MKDARMPVLIGAGQTTDKREPAAASTPVELMAEVACRAAADAGPGAALLQAIDTIVAVGLVVDSPESASGARGMYANVPRTVSNLLGIEPARQLYSGTGGNTPQMLVNRFAEQIAEGKTSAVLLTGAEALNAMIGRLKQGLDLDNWRDDPGGAPERVSEDRASCNAHETSFGLQTPAVTYPLFENALRGKYGWSLDEHRQKMGELYHRFCKVAADNPLAWFPTERSAEEISTPSETNRYVGFPYTKYLNSIIQVNQGAAVIMTSLARARELGVSDNKMVYLHGCGEANDIWNVSERANYYSSPAVRAIGRKALAMAGKTLADMDYFDIYSCFPSAVQIACDELGLAHDDPRGLTVTGGLPYFGGPGNNYVMHSIATMMDVLRRNPGKFGLLNANGWFVTKHALGIYSTEPISGDWQRENPASYQGSILEQDHPPFTEAPEGAATVETYTVLHGRKGVERGLVIGRLQDGTRFIAETPADRETLQALMEKDALGLGGSVSRGDGKNIFVPGF
ncbi:MAG: acetyl-CoA acetyltransferase [Gammaproteobacteria bacterium]|nr:acetyl-CoA acetyltransferase [Gammaproteobacteria bacterium]